MLQRLEQSLDDDTVSASDVAEFLEQAEADDVNTLARWIGGHYPEMKLLLTAAVAPMAEGIPVLDKPYRPLDLLQHIDALLTAKDPDQPDGQQR